MKRLFLAKVGEYRPNLFSDIAHFVNHSGSDNFPEVLRFVKRSDFTFRLYRSNSSSAREPLALVTYSYDPLKDGVNPDKYFPIEIKTIVEALDSYEFVLVGRVIASGSIGENAILSSLQYLTRDKLGRLIDLKTGQVVIKEKSEEGYSAATVLSMFGVIKLGPLPIYYLVLDSGTTSLVDFIEYTDLDNDTIVFPLQDYDGTVAQHLMHVATSENVTRVGTHSLFVKGSTATLTFFTDFWANFFSYNDLQQLPQATISGSCEHIVDGRTIHLKVNKPISTLRIEFNLGRFFDLVIGDEKPVVEFLIYAE